MCCFTQLDYILNIWMGTLNSLKYLDFSKKCVVYVFVCVSGREKECVFPSVLDCLCFSDLRLNSDLHHWTSIGSGHSKPTKVIALFWISTNILVSSIYKDLVYSIC